MKKLLLLVVALATVTSASAQDAATFRQWGNESLAVLDTHLRGNNSTYLYDEQVGSGAAFAWPMGIALKALIYGDRMVDAAGLCEELHTNYYYYGKGYYAYNAVYKSQNDRYYDDNAWIGKDYMDLYDKTGKLFYLNRAKTIYTFCMSGECPSGGIRFHENDSDPSSERFDSYATCATAPTACVCLRLYKATQLQKYLDDGKRLYDFMKAEGWGIGPGYRGYENAVVMQAAILLYEITKEEKYLRDAQNIGHAMEARYISWQTRRLNEVSCWGGHDMTDAYVNMYAIDHDQNWLNIVAGYLTYLHDNCKDAEGYYPESWNDTAKDGKRYLLLDQASAASAFLKMSLTPGGQVKAPEPVAIFQNDVYNNNGEDGGAWSMGLTPGNYTQNDLYFLGLMNNRFLKIKDITSMKIQSGYKVILYMMDNFLGTSKEYTSSISYLGSTWNDRAMSLKVIDLNSSIGENTEESISTYTDMDVLSISNLKAPSRLEMIDMTGRVVFSGETDKNVYTINTTSFKPGVYVLKVNDFTKNVQLK